MKARFFRSDAMSERLGETCEVIVEAEGFQLTYDALRRVPDGDIVATYDSFNDHWLFMEGPAYSDVVLFDDEVATLRDKLASWEEAEDDDVPSAEDISAVREASHTVEYRPANFSPPGLDDGRDVRHEQLRRRLDDDEYEYLRMEAKIDKEG